MKDAELKTAQQHIRLAMLVMANRKERLESVTTKLSRHYNKLNHTHAIFSLLYELDIALKQDPDNWEDNPEMVPF